MAENDNRHTLGMRQLFHRTITILSNAFQRLEPQVPAPQLVPHGDGHVFRFVEKTLTQALLLKLARVITGLKALDILLANGLLQEMASICRMLDEIGEDIAFLAAALTNDEVTELHERYLRGFWAEEFTDPSNTLARHEKPDAPRRSKVQAYVQRVLNPSENPSQMSDVNQAVSSTYSGFVHASAPQVLDLYGGDPPRFHIGGMLGTTPHGQPCARRLELFLSSCRLHHRRCPGFWRWTFVQSTWRLSRHIPGAVGRTC
jgi:hypothetical protein